MGTTANLGIMLHVLSNQAVQEIGKAFRDQVEPTAYIRTQRSIKTTLDLEGCLIAPALGSGARQSPGRHPAER